MSRLAVTRITHSCHLIEIAGATVLTDPWFSHKPGYHPGEPIALTVPELPHLDAILISHRHYDHCDLDALDALPDKATPIICCRTVAKSARAHGFSTVTPLTPWERTTVGPVTVTAAPAAHQVEEITFVLQGAGRTVYFAGDTTFIPELHDLPRRFPAIDLALVPTNGLRLRPLLNKKVVMDAHDAADLVALLRPRVAIPHHYAFTSGPIGDRILTKSDRDPEAFALAAHEASPEADVRILRPGERADLALAAPSEA